MPSEHNPFVLFLKLSVAAITYYSYFCIIALRAQAFCLISEILWKLTYLLLITFASLPLASFLQYVENVEVWHYVFQMGPYCASSREGVVQHWKNEVYQEIIQPFHGLISFNWLEWGGKLGYWCWNRDSFCREKKSLKTFL